ncbi:11S globulin [Linum perenne]
MAKSTPLLLSLCLFAVLLHASVARQQFQQGNECQIDRIDAIEPDNRIQAEAGTTEIWDQNRQQFQCAGVAMVRRTIEPKGLLLPFHSNTPQLIYIIQGRGVAGIMFPGCPETFEESQQTGQQGYRGSGSSQDQHQKIRRFRQGDVIAVPAVGQNFYLAGNPRDEFEESQQGGRLTGRGRKGSSSTCNNLFCGMDSRLIAEAFNVDENVARRLQSENDNRGNIVRVDGELDFVRPPTSMQDERQEQGGRGGGGHYQANGVEETFCSMRMVENIGDPSRADVFTPEAGRIRSVNSHDLPVLRWIQLSAERGVLYNVQIKT